MSQPSQAGKQVAATIEIRDGRIAFFDQVTGFQDSAIVNGNVQLRDSKERQIAMDLVVKSDRVGNDLQLQGSWDSVPTASRRSDKNEITMSLTQTDLTILSPILRQAGVANQITGMLSGKLRLKRTTKDNSTHFVLEDIACERIQLQDCPWLLDPQLTLEDIALEGEVNLNPNTARWSQVILSSNLGVLQAEGGISLADLNRGDPLAAIGKFENQLQGSLDLTVLSAELPKTIHVKPEATVNRGTVIVSLTSTPADDSIGIKVDAAGTDMSVAVDDSERSISPIHFALEATHNQHGFEVTSLNGKGGFFDLRGEGHASKGKLTANLSLDDLHRELSEVIDFKGTKARGRCALNRELGKPRGRRLGGAH